MPITRSLSPDTLVPRMAMIADQRAHPVVRTLRRRREERSKPGVRGDGRRVALVIEGGAMRGVVSAGMASALDQLGLRDAFDEVHGASAGAFNGAFFMAGQAAYMTSLYWRGFGDPRFVSMRRALRGRGPAFDMDYVVDGIWARGRPLRIDVLLGSGIELHCTATDADAAVIVDLGNLHSIEEVRCALRASARLPWLAGEPVSFRGRRLLDATLAEAIPVQAPLETCTDILVLQTRPEGVEHSGLSGPVGLLTDRYLRTINPGLVQLRRTRSERYDELSAWLGRRAAAAAEAAEATEATEATEAAEAAEALNPAEPAICVIRPPADATPIGQLEHRNEALQVAGSEGLRAAWMAIEGEDPEVLDVLRAYPVGGSRPPAAVAPVDQSRALDAAR
jgi:predicted patatin/cPLA2 family phospholipase